MNVISRSMLDRYLRELERDELAIAESADAYEKAKGELEMGLRRYIALRDYVAELLGVNPYDPSVSWPEPKLTGDR